MEKCNIPDHLAASVAGKNFQRQCLEVKREAMNLINMYLLWMLSYSNSLGCYTGSLYSQITLAKGSLEGVETWPASRLLLILEATSFPLVPKDRLLPARNHLAQFIFRRQTGCCVLL